MLVSMSRLRSSLFIVNVNCFKFNPCLISCRSQSTSNQENHYDVLDVSRNSTQSEIKEAYYKLSKQYHPDRNPGDDDASDKFRKITEAYDILSNVDSKRDYDQVLTARDAKSSPYTYKGSPIFREINRNSGKPVDSEDYTQFYKNRQATLGRIQHSTTSFKPPPVADTTEEAINPFNPFINPQPPPSINNIKKYKYYSKSNWEDPGKNVMDNWNLKNDISFGMTFCIVSIFMLVLLYESKNEKISTYCEPPNSRLK